MSVVCLIAAEFTVVRFLSNMVRRVKWCRAIIYVWNTKLHALNQTMRLIILWNIQLCSFKNFKSKIPESWTIVCWHNEASEWHR